MRIVALDELDWSSIVRPGDTVVWGQACGEPTALTRSLTSRRHEIGGRFGVLLGTCYSRTLDAALADRIDFTGTTGTAGNRPLSREGLLDVLPVHYPRVEKLIADGRIPCDVALVQVAPPDSAGRISPGTINDYIRAAIARARVVVAEINPNAPFTLCRDYLAADDIDIAIHADVPLVTVPRPTIGAVERTLARHVASVVPDGAVVQPGVGAIPDAIFEALAGHRDLGIHAGTIAEGVMDLMRSGAVTNARKEIDPGVTITGTLLGTPALFEFAHRNAALRMERPAYTHDAAVVARLSRFISINSALEVDLTGQVNAEAVGRDYVGTIGGQVEYVRAARLSPGGRSIIALPSTGPRHASRIVAQLSGPVTTPRSDVDCIVTEFGVAELAAKTVSQRAAALTAIAHPDHREDLARAAHALLRR